MRRFWLYTGIVSSFALFMFFIIFNYNSGVISYYLLFITLACIVFVRSQLDERHYYYDVNRLLYELLLLYAAINGVIALSGWPAIVQRADDLAFLIIYALQGIIFIMALFKLYTKVCGEGLNKGLFFDFTFQTIFFGAIPATIIYHFYGEFWSMARILGAVAFTTIVIAIFVQLLALFTLNSGFVKYHFSAYLLCGVVYSCSLMAFFLYLVERADMVVFQFLHLISLLFIALTVVLYNYISYNNAVYSENDYSVGDFRSVNFTWVVVIFLIGAYIAKVIYLHQMVIFLMVITVYQYAGYALQDHLQKKMMRAHEESVQSRIERAADRRIRKLAAVNDNLKRHIQYDALTGLLNRRYFMRLIETKIAAEIPFTLLYIDLNRFKEVNDIHGHAVGDEVLITLSNRFKMLKLKNAVIARLGGDEFGALIETVDREIPDVFCARITELINAPIRVNKLVVTMGVSIGVTRYPNDAADSRQLLKNADMAMYRAKGLQTANRSIYYSDNLLVNAHRQNEIDAILKNIDIDKALEVLYKPIINLSNSEIIGLQVRIKWHHEKLGEISPLEFVPIAEKNGTIHEISDWFFINVASQTKIWSQLFNKDLRVHIVISRAILDRAQFISSFNRVVNQLELDASLITCELISNQMTKASDYSVKVVQELHDRGVSIALNGFGEFRVAVDNLERFDVDYIKIGSRTIAAIVDDEDSLAIALAITKLAEGMDISAIAEGVYSDAQIEVLRSFQSANLTEYVYGDFMSPTEFEESYLY